MCGKIESVIEPPPQLPPHPQRPNYKSMQTLNMKSEADRRKTYKEWHVPFMDKNHLAAAGFYFTNCGDVVRCAFCGVEVGYWKEGDNAFADHQRWSPSCGFIKGLFVGNIPIHSETSSPSTNQPQP
jgi:E3 ubiquitin-protein ligase XIAP